MKQELALKVLGQIMDWSDDDGRKEFAWLEYMARFKYDAYRDYVAGGRFLEALVDWLQQFEKSERAGAYEFVRHSLLFFSATEIQHLIELTYPELVKPTLVKRVAAALTVTPYLLWSNPKAQEEYDHLLRRTLFFGLSDGARIDVFRRSNAGIISNEQVLLATEISDTKWASLLADLRSDQNDSAAKFNHVFLLDDFAGTGKTLIRETIYLTDQFCYDGGVALLEECSASRPYSKTEHLARSLWLGRFGWSNRMAMYSAYFDESGHPDSPHGPYMVVAGCVATVDQWVHLEREWKCFLDPLGIEVFHATEFEQRRSPFDRLNDKQAEELLLRLVGVVCRRVEKSVSKALRLDQYNAINAKYVFAESYGFPYPLLARRAMGAVESWMKYHAISMDEVLFFFEDGAKHKGQLLWIADRDKLPEPTFKSKKLIPLQVADLIAWSQNLYLSSGGHVPSIYEKALDRLSAASSEWDLDDLSDTDRLPTILQIPLRDPSLNYKCVVLRKSGRRRAVVQYWPKSQPIQPKVDRKALVLPDAPPLTLEQVMQNAADYQTAKMKTS